MDWHFRSSNRCTKIYFMEIPNPRCCRDCLWPTSRTCQALRLNNIKLEGFHAIHSLFGTIFFNLYDTRNGQVTKYEIQFWKGASPNEKKLRQTTEQKTVFANLDDNTEYKFSVRANTRKGYGPWSTQQSFRTDRNIVRAPLNVKAMATSDSSVQVN